MIASGAFQDVRARCALALALLAAAGCDALLAPGAPSPAALSVTYSVSSQAAGGMEAAFARVDRMAVVVRRGGTELVDTVIALAPGGSEARVSLRVELAQAEESLELAVQLRQADRTLFAGDADVVVRRDGTNRVDVPLDPVAAGVRIAKPLAAIQGTGVTVQLSGAVVFASGDTIPGAALAWATLDPSIVQVSPQGALLSRAVGQARVVGTYRSLADTAQVQVMARQGAITGTVRNAVTGGAVAGASLVLRAGAAAPASDPVAASATAGATGTFAFRDLAPGAYTLFASQSGFVDAVVPGIAVASDRESAQDIVLSPAQAPGETRIVLTWGASPRDLDSYITGPNGLGGAFTVYYSSRGSRTATPFTQLDVDDTNGNGPETITIYRQFAGSYCYGVDNFSEEAPLSASGARVQVYRENRVVATYTVPAQPGSVWTVFKLSGETITPVNAMSSGSAPGRCP